MQLDDELCLCFHVTKRKVLNYLRIERPQTPSQLSECQGAGTGCGWCRPMLGKLWEASRKGEDAANAELPTAEDYAAGRTKYVKEGKGTPPVGGTPVDL